MSRASDEAMVKAGRAGNHRAVYSEGCHWGRPIGRAAMVQWPGIVGDRLDATAHRPWTPKAKQIWSGTNGRDLVIRTWRSSTRNREVHFGKSMKEIACGCSRGTIQPLFYRWWTTPLTFYVVAAGKKGEVDGAERQSFV